MARKAQAQRIDLNSAIPRGLEFDPEWDADAKVSLRRVIDAARIAKDGRPVPKFQEPATVKTLVDDPYSDVGEKRENERSVRADPLGDMLSRRVIDQALYLAGRNWQALAERSTIGAVKAMDPGKEAVDGGRMPEPLTDPQIRAFRELNEAHRRLGEWGSALMRDLLENHMAMSKMAEKYGLTTGRQANFLSLRIRECLEDLAKLWGFAG